jgi:glutamate N-acetyltransferase/amino-acid N-acetyltransferase
MISYKKAILPKGFKASGISSGIKKSGKLDLALFFSESPAKCAGMFTTNSMPAAPVIFDKASIKKYSGFRAIIANSGNANCFTAKAGLADAHIIAASLAKELNINKAEVLVASTGIIGKRFPVAKIKSGLPGLIKDLSVNGIDEAKQAIMTTDIFAKEFSVKLKIGLKDVSICGVAKGAGMIAPNMATLLVFIFTDCHIAQTALNSALKTAVVNSFNCVTVDGCMSTNDSVIILANGAAGNKLIKSGKELNSFSTGLNLVCFELAKMIARDGEGATKFIRIKVACARSFEEARNVALGIANSNLFKTAIYGENPNFGRIVAAVGASGYDISESKLKMKVSSLKKKDINVDVSLGRGRAQAVVYTSDLTPEYVKINAEYS